MTGASDPLAQLHPLHYPPPLPWWQLAWGWWVVIAATVLLAIALGVWLWYRHRRTLLNRYRVDGELLLAYAWEQHGSADPVAYLHALNNILKRVALAAYGESAVFQHATIPALHGKDWVAFLDYTAPAPQFAAQYSSCLTDDLYRGSITPGVDLTALHAAANQWIRLHKADYRPDHV